LETFKRLEPSVAVIGDAYSRSQAERFGHAIDHLRDHGYTHNRLVVVPNSPEAAAALGDETIRGYANGYSETTSDPEDSDRCHQAVSRMRRLIDDLLTLARQGNIIASTAPVELAKPAESAWQTVETEDATLAIETDQEIVADRNRLEQLFGNLYRNAVEHGGPAVTVTVGDIGDGFFVADDGPGIPNEAHDEVFEVGYSTRPDGTGFGWI